jgi:glutamate racemase
MHPKASDPIAIFDSGVGGLTVAEALKERFPQEKFLYLADTASRPFGMKSPDQLREILYKNMRLLSAYPIKMLVIACHTACSSELEIFQELQVPVLSIIPATLKALNSCRNIHSLLVLGTERTIASHTYQPLIKKHFPHLSCEFIPCSPLEKLIEEQCKSQQVILETLDTLFRPIQYKLPEATLLACTHFPLYKEAIALALKHHSSIIDPSHHFVDLIYDTLRSYDLLTPAKETSEDLYLITEHPEIFKEKFIYYFGNTLGKTPLSFNHPYATLS